MKQYVVDAFSQKVFQGNQAAVCVCASWPDDGLMLRIAQENNLSETAFAVKQDGKYRLRWFTPEKEIDLCGHATLACAFVLFRFYEPHAARLTFQTLSGDLTVDKRGDLLAMTFPAYELAPVAVTREMVDALGHTPKEAYLGRDLLCVFDDEQTVRQMVPDMEKVKNLEGLLLHVTAQNKGEGNGADCISRTFAPKVGITEDPVCGSGHCHIVPYWANRLGKNNITAYQASRRGGTLYCEMLGDKVLLAGYAVLFSAGRLMVGAEA